MNRIKKIMGQDTGTTLMEMRHKHTSRGLVLCVRAHVCVDQPKGQIYVHPSECFAVYASVCISAAVYVKVNVCRSVCACVSLRQRICWGCVDLQEWKPDIEGGEERE